MTKIYECSAEVVSPVHIGSGDEYGVSEYIESNKEFRGKKSGKTVNRNIFKKIDIF